jgi:hypothetical protein
MNRSWGHGGQAAGVEPSGAVREDSRRRLEERSPGGRGALGAGTWRSITGAFCIHWVTCCMSFKTPGLYRVFPWGGQPSQPYPLGTGADATTICRVNKCILGKCHFGDKGWKSGWIPALGEEGRGSPDRHPVAKASRGRDGDPGGENLNIWPDWDRPRWTIGRCLRRG